MECQEVNRAWSVKGIVPAGPAVLFVMLNPSTADAEQDDPTIRKCIGFAKQWGFGRLVVGNLFALRATDPDELLVHPDPVGGFENRRHLMDANAEAEQTILAFGGHRAVAERDGDVIETLAAIGSPVYCLGRNKDGSPKHPLYLPYSAERVRFFLSWERQ